MKFDILTLFPEMFEAVKQSVIGKAIEKQLIQINLINIRNFSKDKHKKVDDTPYGGGAGMVMMCEPIDLCISKLKEERKYDEVIYMTPDGETLKQKMANSMSMLQNIIILCGHYKGVDQRVRELHITKEISIGDYVLSGGEIGAIVLCDALIRLIPGVLSDETSALTDSFQDNLLSHPIYTRPAEYKGLKVPDILLSGNFPEIEKWREQKAYEHTLERRPDLLNE
jgi:tRNA (guanine37-N1)-methyltransferase